MRIPYLLYLFLLTCFAPAAVYAQQFQPAPTVPSPRMLPASELGAMAEAVYQTIKDKHPFAFSTEGVAALEAARTQVLADVAKAMSGQDSIAYYEFSRLVSPLQEATQCGHLILEPYVDSLTDVSLRENRFSLHLMPVDSGAQHVLLKGLRTTTDSLLPGTFITAINGMPVGKLIKQLSYFNGINDQGNNYASRVLTARSLSLPYQRYYGLQNSITITAGTGQEQYVILPKYRPWKIPKKTVGDINDVLKFKLSDDQQTGILKIGSFSVLKFNNGNYYKYIRGVIDSLNAGNVPNLIIDLRGNTGGNSNRINSLFSYLSEGKFQFSERALFTGPAHPVAGESAKDQKRRAAGAVTRKERRLQKMLTKFRKNKKDQQRFKGKVVVLIDEITFSASGMFARFVQGSQRGILMGTTAGASANITYGASIDDDKNYYGPRNDFRLRINGIMLELPYPIPGNVTPDITVTPTPQGLREGKDEIMEAALAYLQQGTAQQP